MTMIEKMARAMMLAQAEMMTNELRGLTPQQVSDGAWDTVVPLVRAALIALIEPTASMTEAGDDVEMYGVSLLGIGESHTVFCTMIQAALDESTTPPS